MPKNTCILFIRHAEKPAKGDGLSLTGQARAQAYSIFFQNYLLNEQALKFKYLFASEDSQKSHRPKLTIKPLSDATGLAINDKHKDKEFQKLADDLLQHSKYNDSNILICWHHGEILQFANAMGIDSTKLPVTANWPTKWPGSVFGWVLQIVFDGNGKIVTNQTFCANEMLMYGDYGQIPPGNDIKE